ncbi:hypothetical protein OG21DRAFT_1399650, partial [Imleria badia]
LDADLKSILSLLEEWLSDPSFVVWQILLSAGCPDFPSDQWLNIVKGQAVNLSKVLGACYFTEIDPKQTHDLGDLFLLIALKAPKHSKAIKTLGDWVIAFNKTIEATAYVFPQHHAEYITYQIHMFNLFASIQPTHHDRIIKLDKAIR